MRIPAIAALLVSLWALPGCIYIPPVWDIGDAINKVEWIKTNETTKAQVVKRLGEPDSDFGNSIRYTGKRSYGIIAAGSYGSGAAMLIGERSWYVSIYFDKAGVVRSIDTSETSEQPEVRVAVAADQQLLAKAEQGDVEAQFRVYQLGGGHYWLCRAANQDHPKAQARLGRPYFVGDGRAALTRKVEPDDVQAYKWFSLAASNGDQDAARAKGDLAKKMTPAQVAEAERLVAEWKPDLASCGELPAPAADKDVARDDTGVRPSCGAVGGYEAYMKKTGKVCRLN